MMETKSEVLKSKVRVIAVEAILLEQLARKKSCTKSCLNSSREIKNSTKKGQNLHPAHPLHHHQVALRHLMMRVVYRQKAVRTKRKSIGNNHLLPRVDIKSKKRDRLLNLSAKEGTLDRGLQQGRIGKEMKDVRGIGQYQEIDKGGTGELINSKAFRD